MKIGDVVKLKGKFDSPKIGLLVAMDEFNLSWHTIVCDDEVIHWPEYQIEVVSESR